jgi:hypothetical protein
MWLPHTLINLQTQSTKGGKKNNNNKTKKKMEIGQITLYKTNDFLLIFIENCQKKLKLL